MTITCRHDEALNPADPAQLLTHDVTGGRFAGKATVIIKPAALRADRDAVADAVLSMVDCSLLPGERARMPQTELHLVMFDRRAHDPIDGHIPAVVPSDTLTTVFAPDDDYSEDRVISLTQIFSRAGCPPLNENNEPVRSQSVCHELGHGAGGDEPQADKFAALMTRRAYGDDSCVRVVADMRAVITVASTLDILSSDASLPRALDYVEGYGWKTVEANDSACVPSQKDINAMSDEDIMASTRETFTEPYKKTMALATLLQPFMRKATGAHINDISAAADKLAESVSAMTDDADVQAMAARYALAARRLAGGAPSYRGAAP